MHHPHIHIQLTFPLPCIAIFLTLTCMGVITACTSNHSDAAGRNGANVNQQECDGWTALLNTAHTYIGVYLLASSSHSYLTYISFTMHHHLPHTHMHGGYSRLHVKTQCIIKARSLSLNLVRSRRQEFVPRVRTGPKESTHSRIQGPFE